MQSLLDAVEGASKAHLRYLAEAAGEDFDELARTTKELAAGDNSSWVLKPTLVATDPEDPEALTDAQILALQFKDRGNAATKRGDAAEAERLYTKAIELDASNKAFFTNRAAARLKRFGGCGSRCCLEGALADADAALALDGSWPKAHYRRGVALGALGRHEAAAEAFFDALKLDETNDDIRKALRAAAARGREAKARAKDEEAARGLAAKPERAVAGEAAES